MSAEFETIYQVDAIRSIFLSTETASLFVGYAEEQIFNQFDGPKPELFGRYIDDCLGATSCNQIIRFFQSRIFSLGFLLVSDFIKLNNFPQESSIKPLLHLRASFDSQTPSQA